LVHDPLAKALKFDFKLSRKSQGRIAQLQTKQVDLLNSAGKPRVGNNSISHNIETQNLFSPRTDDVPWLVGQFLGQFVAADAKLPHKKELQVWFVVLSQHFKVFNLMDFKDNIEVQEGQRWVRKSLN